MKIIITILMLFSGTLFLYASPPWSTYHGGSSDDWGHSTAIDVSGNVYITGTTYSTGLATSGAHQTTFGGSYDAYITKFNSSGVRQWTTYYGGSGLDNGNAIAVDKLGNIYVVGSTTSTSGIATSGTFQSTLSGGNAAFIVKFNTSGVRQWGTYYSDISAEAISIDTAGNLCITGLTATSSGLTTSGAYQTTYGGNTDAFIAKFNSGGVRQWATYYGNTGHDGGYAIANDAAGNVFVSCITNSTAGVSSSGAYQTTFGGGNNDILLIKFNSTGSRQWATYYGGSSDDEAYAMTMDTSGNVLITGGTGSSSNIASSGAYQTTYGGNGDAFILKFNTSGGRIWATYFGGGQLEYGFGVTTTLDGSIFVTGQTSSSSGISTAGVYQTNYKGATDAFVAKFNSSGSRQWATYYGDTSADIGYGIAIDGSDNVFITGQTASQSGISTSGASQTTYGGGPYDGFVAAFTSIGGLPVELLSFDVAALEQDGTIQVACHWQTASEINNHYFSVQRSKDGEHFEEIGTVRGAGNTSSTVSYNFTDQTPGTGILYYRLKQTDFDGASSLSETKVIDLYFRLPHSASLVYVDNIPTLNFTSTANQKFTTELFSMHGTAIYVSDHIAKEGYNAHSITTSASGGFYLLRAKFANKEQYFKVLLK